MILSVIAQARKLKTSVQLSLKAELHELTIYAKDAHTATIFEKEEQLIRGIIHAHTISYSLKHIEQSHMQDIDGTWHAHIIINENNTQNMDRS